MTRPPYRRKQYWNEPEMGWYERAYLFEILRGLAITGGVFLRNMGKWMTGHCGRVSWRGSPRRRQSLPSAAPSVQEALARKCTGEGPVDRCSRRSTTGTPPSPTGPRPNDN